MLLLYLTPCVRVIHDFFTLDLLWSIQCSSPLCHISLHWCRPAQQGGGGARRRWSWVCVSLSWDLLPSQLKVNHSESGMFHVAFLMYMQNWRATALAGIPGSRGKRQLTVCMFSINVEFNVQAYESLLGIMLCQRDECMQEWFCSPCTFTHIIPIW